MLNLRSVFYIIQIRSIVEFFLGNEIEETSNAIIFFNVL